MLGLPYLLDTCVLLALVRGKELGKYINQTYQLAAQRVRPLVCIVSQAEIGVLAELNRWGKPKRDILETMFDNLVKVNIDDPDIIHAYIDLYMMSHRHSHGSRANMGQNDLWIAAATKVANATLLTTDKDFDHLYPDHLSRIYIDPASRLAP